MVKDNATGTKMKNKAIWTLCTCLAHLWIKHIMCTDSFNSHNNIRRKIRGLPSVHFRKGEAERGWVAHGELQSWGASPGSLASESLSQPLLLKEKKPRGSLEVTADGSGEEDELPCQHLCMWDSGGDFERPKAKDWHSHLECPREPGTAVVSSCSWHSGGLMLFQGTAVVSCCSRGQRWSHAVPGTVVVPPGFAGCDKKRCCCSGSAQRVEGWLWLGMDVSPRLAPPLTTCWSLGLDLPSCKDDYSFTTRWEWKSCLESQH